LTLRALLKSAAGRLELGVPGRAVMGLNAPAKALFAAAAVVRDRAVLVAPTDADVERMTSDCRFFLTALEGLSDAEAEAAVLPFPSHEIDPYRGLAPHFDVASARARALHALATGATRLVVSSAAAWLPRLTRPERLKRAALSLRTGQDISPVDLSDLLAEAGYTRQDPTDEPGEFSARGGVVDFYPAGARQPIRLEFVGDTIESIRTYDPSTQRSTGGVDQAHIVPLQELLADGAVADRGATLLDYLAAAGRPLVLVSEADEVRASAVKVREQIDASYADALRRNDRAAEPAALFVSWDDIAPVIDAGTALQTLALESGDGARHVACQPAMEFAGRVRARLPALRHARDAAPPAPSLDH